MAQSQLVLTRCFPLWHRLAAAEKSVNADNQKKTLQGDIGHVTRADPAIHEQMVANSVRSDIGSGSWVSNKSATHNRGCSSSCDLSLNGLDGLVDSPGPSQKRYQLRSTSNHEGLGLKLSPGSDMVVSSNASPRSVLSQESVTSRDLVVTSKNNWGSQSPTSNDVHVDDLSFEIAPGSRDFLIGEDPRTTNQHCNRQLLNPRLKRILAPTQVMKQTETFGSSLAKKSGSSGPLKDEGVVLADKPSTGTRAIHPILDKLRRSWGSALRVQQRQAAVEAESGSIANHSSCQKDVVSQKVGSETVVKRCNKLLNVEWQHQCTSGVHFLDATKLTSYELLSELERRQSPKVEATEASDTMDLVRDAVLQRLILPRQASSEIQGLSSNSNSSSVVPEKLRKSNSLGNTEKVLKWNSTPSLTKIQTIHHRSKSDVSSKFKKQYSHADSGSSNASMKGDRGNMISDMRMNATTISPAGLVRKSYLRKSSMPEAPKQLDQSVGSPQNVPALPFVIRTSLQSRNEVTSKVTCVIRQSGEDGADSPEKVRKSKLLLKYEPRLHSVKAIKEWEAKSGRRYYDLQPYDRQKANQEISASLKMVTKRR